MFSNLTIAFLFGVSIGTWIYAKMMRSTGNNVKNSLTVAAISGVLIIIILTAVFDVAFKHKK